MGGVRSADRPPLVWQHKKSFGMSIEVPCQTDLSSTFLDDDMGTNAPTSALHCEGHPYKNLRTHWATHDPDHRESRAVRQQRGMAFYGAADAGVQTELSQPDLLCQEGDNRAFRLGYDEEPAFISLDRVLGTNYAANTKPEPDLAPSGMAHLDRLLNEYEWYR